jgi:SAM-dependent methyltransferase
MCHDFILHLVDFFLQVFDNDIIDIILLRMNKRSKNTSWQKVAPWYSKLVGSEGHYFHEHVILPKILKILNLKPIDKLIDFGCGQGVLARSIPVVAKYLGIDVAEGLIEAAKRSNHRPFVSFLISDATRELQSIPNDFSHAVFMLSLQNMKNVEAAILNASKSLKSGGKLVLVLNHPCFRIPRQSGWGINEQSKQQYRWINRYSSPLEIPINMTPGDKSSKITWSFHHSLNDYFLMLKNAGFYISDLEEWGSDKKSVGKAASMENRAREEIPLFLCLVGVKK